MKQNKPMKHYSQALSRTCSAQKWSCFSRRS